MTPGSAPASGSTSCGRARSTIASSRPSAVAAATIAAVTMAPAEPVHETTTSATASSASRSLSSAERAPYSPASRSALPAVRLATVTLAAPRRDSGRGREAGHRAGTEHQGPLAGQVADGGVAAVEGGRDQRGRGPVDVRLGPGPLADPQRLLEEHVEGRTDGADLLPGAERVAGLAEDLALADGHRVETGDDLEEVGDGAVVVVHVEVRDHRLGGLAGPLDEQPGHLLDAAVEAVDVGVDLEAVAGRDDRRLGDVLARGDVVDQLVHARRRRGRPAPAARPARTCGRCPRPERSCAAAPAFRCSW